jgi:osmoprotectant transport system permease protein
LPQARSAEVVPVVTVTAHGPRAARAGPVVVGAKTFTEQYVLAELIAKALTARGIEVERKFSLGSSVVFDALARDRVDVYVDYTGTLWANGMKRTDAPPRWRVNAALRSWLAEQHGIRLLGALGFENAYALAMRRDRAAELDASTIADLARHSRALRIGGDYEFFQRPEWTRVRDAYGLQFREIVSFDSTFLYEAVTKREVDVVAAFSSDGRIALNDLVVLEDTAKSLPPYDAVLLLSPSLANDERALAALTPLVSAIDVELIRRASAMVDREVDKKTPREAAEWLGSEIALPR